MCGLPDPESLLIGGERHGLGGDPKSLKRPGSFEPGLFGLALHCCDVSNTSNECPRYDVPDQGVGGYPASYQ